MANIALVEELAVAIVPIAIIPQIIHAGVVAGLSGLAEGLSRCLITVYWGQKTPRFTWHSLPWGFDG